MVAEENENQFRKYGLIGTLIFHGLLAALFFFMVFEGPNPPLSLEGGSGIELNYGTDAAGSGDVQSMASANNSTNTEDSKPAAKTDEPAEQPTVEKQVATPAQESKVITGAEESGYSVKENDKPQPKEEKKEEVKVVEKPKSLYPGKSTAQNGSNGNTGSSNNATGNNNGDKPGQTGDQGDPNGSLNAKDLYGKPGKGGSGDGGSGGGAKLNMLGWAFDTPPRPNDESSESGRIVLNIKVNKDGEIVYCVVQESNVSPAVTKLYKDAVTKASLSPTGGNGTSDAGASGTVTFILKAR